MKTLCDQRGAAIELMAQAHFDEVTRLQREHKEEMTQLRSEHEDEIKRLKAGHKMKMRENKYRVRATSPIVRSVN
jgi:hypothetical protein